MLLDCIHDNTKFGLTNAVIGMNCFSEFNTVEKISRKSKITWMQAFMNTRIDVLKAFRKLIMDTSEEIILIFSEFIAKVYMRKFKNVKT